jgi:hypothetical protein
VSRASFLEVYHRSLDGIDCGGGGLRSGLASHEEVVCPGPDREKRLWSGRVAGQILLHLREKIRNWLGDSARLVGACCGFRAAPCPCIAAGFRRKCGRVAAARSARRQSPVSRQNFDPEDVIAKMGLLVVTVDARCHVRLCDARHVAHIR